MDTNKIVAQTELEILGGIPIVNRYWDNSENRNIDVIQCTDVPHRGVQSCASIGLNNVDLGLQSEGKKLRVEILGASDASIDYFKNIVASVAFDIMNSHRCYPGYVAENVIQQYIKESDMKHILLTDPFLWGNIQSVSIDNIFVAWLMIVPISEKEYQYAQKEGVDALEKLFEEKEIDIYNIYRKSVI